MCLEGDLRSGFLDVFSGVLVGTFSWLLFQGDGGSLGERAPPAAGWMWGHPGDTSATSTPPPTSDPVGGQCCPSLGDPTGVSLWEKGLFWEGTPSSLPWQPFLRRFDLLFHFFLVPLEQHGEVWGCKFRDSCCLGKGTPVDRKSVV